MAGKGDETIEPASGWTRTMMIEFDRWQPCGYRDSKEADLIHDHPGRLVSSIQLFGGDYHVNAYRVKVEADGMMVFDSDEDPDVLDAIYRATVSEGPFETVKIPGFVGDYILLISPFCT